MASRSWMAAWLLAAGLIASARADDQRGKTSPSTPSPSPSAVTSPVTVAPVAAAASGTNTVKLELRIAGLTARGCDVEIKPAHAGCTFRKLNEHVASQGLATIELKDIRSLSPDRDCTLSITIREPGQGERTVHRGLRLRAPGDKGTQMLTCYLSCPSRVARSVEGAAAKR